MTGKGECLVPKSSTILVLILGFLSSNLSTKQTRADDLTTIPPAATVATLIDQVESEGDHSVEWNGKDTCGNGLASGVYFYSITTNGSQQTRKMIVLK